jgi:hypothetical protein
MRHNKHIKDDLDHLSELGYEAVPGAEKDVDELKQKIRGRYGSNPAVSSSFIALIIGLFLGITVFFTIYNTPVLFPSHDERVAESNTLKNYEKRIDLDTIQVNSPVKELVASEKFIEPTETDTRIDAETLEPIALEQVTLENNKTLELKYSPNAPIVYLHDLKIANYQFYYFTSQKMVIIHQNVNADRANKTETSHLNDGSGNTYYLHQAIDDAMKAFKKQRYAECLSILNTVSEFSKNDVNCDFYRGMCNFYLMKYEEAYKFFQLSSANTVNVFAEESVYYLALSALKTKRQDEGKKLLGEIAGLNGFYSSKAKEQLK